MILDSLRYWVTEMHVDGFRFDLTPALTRTGHRVDLGRALHHHHRAGPRAAAREADRRAVGRQHGRLPGRPVPAAVVRVERPVPRHGAGLLAARVRRHPRRRLAAGRLLATCTPTTAARRTPRSTSSPRTTASRCATWSPTTASTTRPTGSTTATAPTTTGPGTAASRARPTTPTVVALRRKQAANLLATLCLSAGVPMITAGDERGRTQGGNNNAYGQDNEISWMDWRPDDAWLDLYDVAKTALRLRREHPALRQRHFLEGRPTVDGGPKDLAWVHPEGREMTEADWFDDTPAHLRDVRLRRTRCVLPARAASSCTTRRSCCGSTRTPSPARPSSRPTSGCSSGEVVLSTDSASPGRRAGLRRRGRRHRAALPDRAPPALTPPPPTRHLGWEARVSSHPK